MAALGPEHNKRRDEGPIPLEPEALAPERPPPPRPAPALERPAMPRPRASRNVGGAVCAKCGYDISGLKSMHCPECGTELGKAMNAIARKKDFKKQLSAEYVRSSSIMVVSLAAALAVFYWKMAGGASTAAMGLGVYLGLTIAGVIVGYIVFFACSMLWIGFDQPPLVTILRLTALYAIADIPRMLCSGIPFVRWLLPGAIYMWLMSLWLDLDSRDAFLVTALTITVQFVVGLLLVILFLG